MENLFQKGRDRPLTLDSLASDFPLLLLLKRDPDLVLLSSTRLGHGELLGDGLAKGSGIEKNLSAKS